MLHEASGSKMTLSCLQVITHTTMLRAVGFRSMMLLAVNLQRGNIMTLHVGNVTKGGVRFLNVIIVMQSIIKNALI